MLARTQFLIRALCVMSFAAVALRAADNTGLTVTEHPILRVTVLNDLNGWAQSLKYEIYNPDSQHFIALIVHKDSEEDVIVSVQDAEGFPVHKPLNARPAIDPVDRKVLGYRYQIIAPQSSYVSYALVPAEVVDRTASAAGEAKIIPIPASTYTLKLTSAFRYTTLAEGVDSYAENPAKPPNFLVSRKCFPNP